MRCCVKFSFTPHWSLSLPGSGEKERSAFILISTIFFCGIVLDVIAEESVN